MRAKQYEKVMMDNGLTATVVEILGIDKNKEHYIVDVDLSSESWETGDATEDNIVKIL
jgi:hypothetical protein